MPESKINSEKMRQIKIVIAEDDPEIRNGYCFLINYSNEFKCAGFSSAESLLVGIEKELPEIILMDVNLPGMSGIECTRIIKQKYPDIQILMFTVYENNENVFSALEAGASGYILKQAAPGEIISAIKELISGGAPMSAPIAKKVVLSFSQIAVRRGDNYLLSEREEEVLRLLAEGFRYKDIAEKLFISISTVRTHIFSIYEKLHVHNRTEALNKFNSSSGFKISSLYKKI
jgi:DNA-binding NarL/FixJ family response regulator